MAYLRINRKHMTPAQMARSCQNQELNQHAQFWLIHALIASQGQLKTHYLVTRGSVSRNVSRRRHMAQYLCNVAFGLSPSFIGRLCHRHRTSVMEACYDIEDMRDNVSFDKSITYSELAVVAMYASIIGDHG